MQQSQSNEVTIHAQLASERSPDATATTRVATFPDHTGAEQAVDMLIARGFPVEDVAIEGTALRIVERITGVVTYNAAIGGGVLAGAPAGLALGIAFGLLDLLDPTSSTVVQLAWAAILGGIIGAALGCTRRWLQEGRHDFTSQVEVIAGRYELLCAPDRADDAISILTPPLKDTGLATVRDAATET
jgi:hypothetical protein